MNLTILRGDLDENVPWARPQTAFLLRISQILVCQRKRWDDYMYFN